MLQGKGFNEIYNLSGGIKAWQDKVAVGPEDQGLQLFEGLMSLPESLIVAYSLEQGLEDFYRSQLPQIENADARAIFQQLAEIEIVHQESILKQYNQATGQQLSREAFEKRDLETAIEGGLTTEEYLERFQPDLNAIHDVISLAMSIEAQALDLYMRAAANAQDTALRDALKQIGREERGHLNELGNLMDRIKA
jgi:rubrerythrin